MSAVTISASERYKINRPRRAMLRLLTEADLARTNPDTNKSRIVSWAPVESTPFSLGNMGVGVVAYRVVLQQVDSGIAYDQIVLFENPGSVVLISDRAGRVAMIQQFRMTGERPNDMIHPSFVRAVVGHEPKAIEVLGEWRWEAPRGFGKATAEIMQADTEGSRSDMIRRMIIQQAKAEALEEAGAEIKNARIVGKVNPNGTYFPFPQYVVAADLVSITEQAIEDRESIGDMRMIPRADVQALIEEDAIIDAFTMAALLKGGAVKLA